MGDNQGEAVFHAAKLLQLYDETESVAAVTKVAAALLAERPTDHVHRVAWFLPPDLIRVLPKQHRSRIVPLRPGLGSSPAMIWIVNRLAIHHGRYNPVIWLRSLILRV